MADTRKDEGTPLNLLEFEPLSRILSAVPHKSQRGLFKNDVEWTCLDVTSEFVAIGTNSSHVCLFDRATGQVQKLNVRIKNCMISCVRLINSVDYEVAVGTSIGHLFVFVLPSILPGKNNQLQMFRMTGFHPSPIRCLEWSQNAMKLFSGDEDGVVVCTEIDYTVNQSQSYVVCKEAHGVVQLSYAYRTLLVSTTFRTVLCKPDSLGKVIQVGQKDRKVQGTYGGVIVVSGSSPDAAILFTSRPGLRLWKAKLDGSVLSTYIFKDLITAMHHNLSLLSSTSQGLVPSYLTECQFGRILLYQDKCVVTYHDNELYVINTESGVFSSYHTSLGHIVEVAVCGDEIFVLRQVTGRPLIRLAYSPEPHRVHGQVIPSSLPVVPTTTIESPSDEAKHKPTDISPVQVITETASKMSLSFVGAMKGVGEKIQSVSEGATNSVKKIAPWNSSPNTNQRTDLNAMGRSTDSTSESVDSAREMSPSFVPSPTNSASPDDLPSIASTASQSDKVTLETNRTHPADIPPIVKLEGDQLTIITVEPRMSSVKGAMNSVESVDSASSSACNHGNESIPSPQGHYGQLDAVGREEYEEVVYFRKAKKAKKKKPANIISDIESTDIASMENSPSPSPIPEALSLKDSQHDSNRSNNPTPPPLTMDQSTLPMTATALSDSRQAFAPTTTLDVVKLKSESLCLLDDLVNEVRNEDSQILPGNSGDVVPTASVEGDDNRRSVCTNQIDYKAVATDVVNRASPIRSDTKHVEDIALNLFTQELDNTPRKIAKVQPTVHPVAVKPLKVDVTHDTVGPLPELTSPQTPLSPKSTESDTEDFYSKYCSRSVGGSSTQTSVESEQDIQTAIDTHTPELQDQRLTSSSSESSPLSTAQLADSWMDFPVPAQVQSLCLTNRHIWIVDKWNKVYYSSLSGAALRWTEVADPAKQMAVAPSGGIVWRLHKGLLYVGLQVSAANPAGKSAVNIARDVAFVAVDDTVAWYVKSNGEVGMHKGLSRSCPHSHFVKVGCNQQLLQIACRHGVVWALTTDRNIIIREGIVENRPEGRDWRFLQGSSEGPCQLVTAFAFGDLETAWILDVVGRVWFTTGVNMRNPSGSGHWWQVSMSEYLMQDSKASVALQALLGVSQNLGKKLVHHEKGGAIAAGSQGIWMCEGQRDVLHSCRGSMSGHRWDKVILSGMLASTKWHHVSATAVQENEGMIWAQQNNGSFFCFPANFKHSRVLEVAPPVAALGSYTIAATQEALWVLQTNGAVYIRAGMGPHCLQGIKWVPLNLTQLGDDCTFAHLCCGTENVWAVDDTGQVYMRIGVQAPLSAHLSPAWVPVDGCPKDSSAKFIKVYVGPDDRMVWALDNKMNVYVRKGITDTLPVGSYWSYVSGTPALSLCVSTKMVYAVNQAGELLVRYGVTPDYPDGDYWKKIPGVFGSVSVTADDELWAINHDDLLHKRHTQCLQRQRAGSVLQSSAGGSTEEGWELL